MYVRPDVFEIDIATSASCCTPSPDPYQECASKGGIWLKTGGAMPSCYTMGTPGEMVQGWLNFVSCMGDNYANECEVAIISMKSPGL